MDFNKIYNELIKYKNESESLKMSAYMLNHFSNIGIRTPERRKLLKNIFKEGKKERKIDWKFIDECWENEYRELQYSALDYINETKKFLTYDDIPKLKKYIVWKSWWDTIDSFDKIVGAIALNYPEVNEVLLEWSRDDNFWLRRVAIDHQLLRKEKTNKELMEKILINNLNQKEFFINKAIGWALRDYSKTNPEWVRTFIENNKEKMSKLSIKEGSKYI